jgi:hypothetical protein
MFFNKLFKRCSLQPSISPGGCLPGTCSARPGASEGQASFYR